MAISRGAGTEIIRSVMLEDCDSTTFVMIFGVQHHVYTVLSTSIYANAIATAGNFVQISVLGYDVIGGTSAQNIIITKQDMQLAQTFVYNDKFSFNGNEPTDFSATLDSIAKQDAIADQASSVAQKFQGVTEAAGDSFEIVCTYIDQNNA
jgi:hypothetical protein